MSKPIPVVDDYMTRDPLTLNPSDDVHAAIKMLLDRRHSGAPVIDGDGRLVGILSQKDCLKVVYSASYHQDWGGRVDDYMSAEVATLTSGTDIISAADKFMHSKFRRFPVVRDGGMIGLICRHDVLRALDDLWPHD